MIYDFSDGTYADYPYLLIDGEGEMVSDAVGVIDLDTGRGTRFDKDAIERGDTDGVTSQNELERTIYKDVEYVPPLTLVSGSGLVVAQGRPPEPTSWTRSDSPFIIVEGSP